MSTDVDQDLIDEIWGPGAGQVGQPGSGTATNSNPENVTEYKDDLWGSVTVETGDVDLPDPDAANTTGPTNEDLQTAPNAGSGGNGQLIKDDLWGDVTVEGEDEDLEAEQGTEGNGEDGTTIPGETESNNGSGEGGPNPGNKPDGGTTTQPDEPDVEDDDRIYFDGPTSAD